jgi:secreted Zn-dependent insulinase-like peptidase
MSRWSRAALTAFTICLLSAPLTYAQGGRGQGFGMGGGALALLRNPDVHKELKLEEAAIEKFTALSEEMGGSMRERFQGLQDLSQEERREAMNKLMSEINTEVSGKVKGILSEEQMSRYNQLVLQSRGPDAFNDEEVAAKLKITDDQKTKISSAIQSQREEMGALFQQGGGGDPQERFQKMADLRKATMEKIQATLTEDQKKTWAELTGKPFEFRPRIRRDG